MVADNTHSPVGGVFMVTTIFQTHMVAGVVGIHSVGELRKQEQTLSSVVEREKSHRSDEKVSILGAGPSGPAKEENVRCSTSID